MPRRYARTDTPDEMLKRRIYIRQLHAAGFPRAQIFELAAKQGYRQVQAEYLLGEIRKDLRVEAERQAPENYAAALDRAYTDLSNIRLDVAGLRNQVPKNWPAIHASQRNALAQERFIAELEGTLRPVKVEVGVVGVSDALQRVLVAMTPEMVERAVIEERERQRDAGALVTTASTSGAPPPALSGPSPAALIGGRRPHVPAARAADRVDRSPQADGGSARESVSAAPHVDQRPAARGLGVRVAT